MIVTVPPAMNVIAHVQLRVRSIIPDKLFTKNAMATKLEAPFTGTEIDTGDPVGSVKNLLMGMLAVAIMLFVFAGGQRLFNFGASNVNAVDDIEVF